MTRTIHLPDLAGLARSVIGGCASIEYLKVSVAHQDHHWGFQSRYLARAVLGPTPRA